jgi:hypothetical protein
VDDRRTLDRLQDAVDAARESGDGEAEFYAVEAYNQHLDAATARQWWLGGLVAFALVDAYVDAHFRNFKVNFEGDPALPGGTAGSARVSLSYRWTF